MLFYSNPNAVIGTYFQDDLKQLLETQYSDCFFCQTLWSSTWSWQGSIGGL